MELRNIKKIVVDSLVSILDENDIKNISVDDNTEIFGSKSIIDSLHHWWKFTLPNNSVAG